ncbi:MAG: TonB family protein [Nostoc sp. NMS7]|uniref:energy transducer TonB n=1 Tax=Nostoc sp. NMS7 TaxID=2815391 RepID=UPI0025DC3B91|nr:TonB family protein [Nostoc sp. NMS7]MBN3946565.1 TonB family protein [Nostoc sp. NMS7]
MSFSGTTVEQRSKEVEALKSFLTYSLIGSLALHIGVLSSGIGNYLTRVSTGEEEPMEVAIIDSPTAEPEKPLEKIPEKPKKEPEIIQKQPREISPVQKPVQELIERPKIQPVQEQPKQTTQNPQPTNREIAPKAEVPVKTVAPVSGGGGGGGGSPVLTDNSGSSGSGVALSTGSGSGIGSGIGSGRGSGIGSGIGSGVGKRPTVATAPTVPTPPQINSSGNGNGNVNGRAACRECNAKYPDAARRRGVEGRVEVAVDTDSQGNVTNVRIARSSGNRELDEETARQAREWKLKPAEGGRQGVSIATEFAIKGSRRSRQVQERQAQREAEERTQQAAAANSTPENPRRRRRELTPPSNEATATRPAISGLSRRLEPQRREIITSGSSSEARINRTQGSARDSLRSIQRERAGNDSSQQPQATPTRRRQGENTSQNKLRESLRRLRPQPQSQPAAPPATPSQP